MSDHTFSVFVGKVNIPALGDWMEIAPGMDTDEIAAEIAAIMEAYAGSAEAEHMISDVESVPAALVGEWASADHLALLAEAAEAAEDAGIPLSVLWHFADLLGTDSGEIADLVDDLICHGDWDECIADLLEAFVDSDFIRNRWRWLDTDAIRRDLEIQGTYAEIDGELWEYLN